MTKQLFGFPFYEVDRGDYLEIWINASKLFKEFLIYLIYWIHVN